MTKRGELTSANVWYKLRKDRYALGGGAIRTVSAGSVARAGVDVVVDGVGGDGREGGLGFEGSGGGVNRGDGDGGVVGAGGNREHEHGGGGGGGGGDVDGDVGGGGSVGTDEVVVAMPS